MCIILFILLLLQLLDGNKSLHEVVSSDKAGLLVSPSSSGSFVSPTGLLLVLKMYACVLCIDLCVCISRSSRGVAMVPHPGLLLKSHAS